MKFKKAGILTLSSAIAFGGFIPFASAEEAVNAVTANAVVKESQAFDSGTSSSSTTAEEQSDSVSKKELVARIKEVFPNKFDFLQESDFNLGFSHRYPEEPDVERYRIDFHKQMSNDNYIHGSFEFTGEDLELTEFYYQPSDRSGALFPPKVTEEEAQEVASSFISKIGSSDEYKLDEANQTNYYSNYNRPLTQPIEYRFTFNKLKNGIPIQDQSLNVTILGNGEITQFYSGRIVTDESFEASDSIISKEDAEAKWKESIDVQLKYFILNDYQSGESEAYLIYDDIPKIQSITASSGELKINGEVIAEAEADDEFKPLGNSSKEASPITKAEAEELAKSLLKPTDGDNGKLTIEGVYERETPEGDTVFDVQYMYRTASGGHGSSISIKKSTGELLNFHNYRNYPYGEEVELENEISQEKALEEAVEYIKEYAYTSIDEFAYPTTTAENNVGPIDSYEYRFYFPRVKDGMEVVGNGINVTIDKEDGSLNSLYVNYTEIDEWPSTENVSDPSKALEAHQGKIELNLMYVNQNRYSYSYPYEAQEAEYELEYVPTPLHYGRFFDAISGTWHEENPNFPARDEEPTTGKIDHPWAAEELNYMIEANIIKVDDVESFDANKAVTKGEALEILSKSLRTIYPRPMMEDAPETPFTNITKDHPLYDVIMAAVESGIIDSSGSTFNVDETLTREELAYWYVRSLGLDEVAQHEDIFNYDFADTANMDDEYKGYIVIANALGLLTKDNNDNFLPKGEVTIAQLAVANIRLAKQLTEMDNRRYY